MVVYNMPLFFHNNIKENGGISFWFIMCTFVAKFKNKKYEYW